jgi:hypothetical protein
MSETATITGSALVAAIETFWGAVAERHPELPAEVIAVTGGGKVQGGTKLGHWARERWTVGTGRRPELFVSGECFSQGGRYVAETILHEAAHALLIARGDETGGTSRQMRYHTKKGFVPAAEEMGLRGPDSPDLVIGFSDCTITDETAERYADEIEALDAALGAHIMMITLDTLKAWAVVVGFLMAGGSGIIPWWLGRSPEGIWVGLGGGVTKPRKPRVRRERVVLACGCRTLRLPAEEAADLEDLDCRRCGEALERQ